MFSEQGTLIIPDLPRTSGMIRVLDSGLTLSSLAAVRLSVDVLHVDLEVVVAGELLVAQKALGHGPVGVVRELVSAQHLLQAEGEVAHLGDTKSTGYRHRTSSPWRTGRRRRQTDGSRPPAR